MLNSYYLSLEHVKVVSYTARALWFFTFYENIRNTLNICYGSVRYCMVLVSC